MTKIDSLTSREINEKWIEDLFKKDAKENQLMMIVEKLKIDSIVTKSDIKETINIIESDYTSYDTVELSEAFKRTKKCKILFVLDNRGSMYLLDLIKFPHFFNVFEDFTTETIEEI